MSQNWWIEVENMKENRILLWFNPEHEPYCINLYQVLTESASQMSQINLVFFFLEIVTDFKKITLSEEYWSSV